MIGYKAFNKDLTCRDFQYKIGETYEMKEKPICCERGFHFCKNLKDVYRYYKEYKNTRICEIESIGDIVTDDGIKFCTNKIIIAEEVKDINIKNYNTGYFNYGYGNSGDCNSGNYNSGNYNSGDYNSGNYNYGNYNSGNYNSGYRNSGDYNSGDYNSGNYNSGGYNSGNYNSGNYNSGNYNSGNCNTGFFNTTSQKLRLFNHETDLEFYDKKIIKLKRILSDIPIYKKYSTFVYEKNMTEEEKEEHPEYKTTGGFIKNIEEKPDILKWWNEDIDKEDKEFIKSLPYYDEDIFLECLGIK